jgi:hypothetical protein
MQGGLTNAQYMHTCVFIDHYLDLSYVHLLKSQSGEEVLKAKEAFEAYANTLVLKSNTTMLIMEFLMGKPGGSRAPSPTKACHLRWAGGETSQVPAGYG